MNKCPRYLAILSEGNEGCRACGASLSEDFAETLHLPRISTDKKLDGENPPNADE